ncbi:MAG: phosphoribosylformylglycinamidine synthase subunit PurL [Pseudopedobacter sp.]|nr:phosphoribosylformylglycinamidine synthase subunit PurL [Deinococcales bacterium]
MTQIQTPTLRDRAQTFGLSLEEFDLVVDVMEREPNPLEAAIFGAMWSEHCGYKNSRPLFSRFPTTGPQVLQGPGENAGVVDIGDGFAVAFKMESHNHPSAVEPVQGAATGVGGILRDIFAMGARPFAVLDSLRFGDLSSARTRFLLHGEVEGIAMYGNAMGVATVGGEITFHPSFEENPLVNVMALGLMRHEDLAKGTMGEEGNQIYYVGSKTGRDGLGGAVFASADLSSDSAVDRPAVQVGDPFMEKLLLEATLEAIRAGLVAGVQDMGAAGLTSSTVEMAYRANLGVDLHLERVPMRETGMIPLELMLSESQERMILVPIPGMEQALEDLLAKYELDVVTIGEVAAHGRYKLYWHGELVGDMPVNALNEAPKYTREGVESEEIRAKREMNLSSVPIPENLEEVLLKLLSHPTIASKRPIFERFDHQVGANSVLLPGQADAAVMRIKGSSKGVAATSDCNPRFVYLDPYWGAASAVAEAARNLVCVGAKPLAITDNLNFGNPHRPDVYYQLERSVQGIADACLALGTPVTGGNVSLYNQYVEAGRTVAIHPTPTIGMVGVLEDISKRATMGFKRDGDVILLIGENSSELGASQYLETIHGLEAGQVPRLGLDYERDNQFAVRSLIAIGWCDTAHDCSDGGLAVALSEMCIAGNNGARVSFDPEAYSKAQSEEFKQDVTYYARADLLEDETVIRADALLFGEAQSRFVVAVKAEDINYVLSWLRVYMVAPYQVIGRVGGETLELDLDRHELKLSWSLEQLREAFEKPLLEAMA